jgi:hypothetical protein
VKRRGYKLWVLGIKLLFVLLDLKKELFFCEKLIVFMEFVSFVFDKIFSCSDLFDSSLLALLFNSEEDF